MKHVIWNSLILIPKSILNSYPKRSKEENTAKREMNERTIELNKNNNSILVSV